MPILTVYIMETEFYARICIGCHVIHNISRNDPNIQ